jgi:Fe-S oxidoreductase
MATLDEKDSTRGRANVFRNVMLEGPDRAMKSHELKDVLDRCLSCKACKSECPASVDMARLKAEFLQHYQDEHGVSVSGWFFANYARLSRMASWFPRLSNFLMTFGPTRALMGKILQLAPARKLPAFAPQTFRSWWSARAKNPRATSAKTVWLYVDPFTEFTEPQIAQAAVHVLEHLGYGVNLLPIEDDGRTQLSKGFVRAAKTLANANIRQVKAMLDADPQLTVVGLEPSSLLTFRDETPDLVDPDLKATAQAFAERCLLFDEFLDAELSAGQITLKPAQNGVPLVLHGHCHQKALVGNGPTQRVLTAAGYDVQVLPTGCCGMAGSFGYEARHHELSMSVGELVLFPRLRKVSEGTAIAAPGTSCRHQIADGTQRHAEHPAVLVARALGISA